MSPRSALADLVAEEIERCRRIFCAEVVPPAGDERLFETSWGARRWRGSEMHTEITIAHQWPMPSTELARAYLRAHVAPRKFSRRVLAASTPCLPSFFRGPVRGELVYADVAAAFFSIWSRIPPDSHYVPGASAVRGVERWEDLGDIATDKLARNALPYLATAGVGVMQTARGVHRVPRQASSPALIAVISDTLQAVAHLALAAGAFSWTIDGGIMRPDAADTLAEEVRTRFNLDLRVTHSDKVGRLDAPGCYRVGDRVGRSRATDPSPRYHLLPPHVISDRISGISRLIA